MLAVESFTEVVSFLPLFDLDSVLLSTRQLSDIASKCVKDIRIWEFNYVLINVSGDCLLLTVVRNEDA